ncbi:hypothetical protein B0J14DRAFT_647897 [Halenospora varia]|nr:hypothetical protein B0J14DRAFT_647897 [Halenospora varia]
MPLKTGRDELGQPSSSIISGENAVESDSEPLTDLESDIEQLSPLTDVTKNAVLGEQSTTALDRQEAENVLPIEAPVQSSEEGLANTEEAENASSVKQSPEPPASAQPVKRAAKVKKGNDKKKGRRNGARRVVKENTTHIKDLVKEGQVMIHRQSTEKAATIGEVVRPPADLDLVILDDLRQLLGFTGGENLYFEHDSWKEGVLMSVPEDIEKFWERVQEGAHEVTAPSICPTKVPNARPLESIAI